MTDTIHDSAATQPDLPLSMRHEADLLREFWVNSSGTSLHMRAADLLDLAADLVAAMPPQAPGWRPIAEASKENSVLGYMPNRQGSQPYQAVIFWDDELRMDDEADDVKHVGGWSAGRVDIFSYEEYAEEYPTHFCPLPAPPSEASE